MIGRLRRPPLMTKAKTEVIAFFSSIIIMYVDETAVNEIPVQRRYG